MELNIFDLLILIYAHIYKKTIEKRSTHFKLYDSQ